jgi:hypothetical protein
MPGGAKPWPGSDGAPRRREISRQMQSAILGGGEAVVTMAHCAPTLSVAGRKARLHIGRVWRLMTNAELRLSADRCQRDQPAPRPLGRQTQQMGCRPSPMAGSSFSAQ